MHDYARATRVATLLAVLLTSCARPPAQVTHAAEPAGTLAVRDKREIRLTGTIEAVHSSKVLVPQIFGPGGPMTLTKFIANGVQVKENDLVAVFDSTAQVDAARAAQARNDDLAHQTQQKAAQIRADAEKRTADLRQAEANLAKAEFELQKGPVLPDIKLMQAKIRAEMAREQVASLKKSNA